MKDGNKRRLGRCVRALVELRLSVVKVAIEEPLVCGGARCGGAKHSKRIGGWAKHSRARGMIHEASADSGLPHLTRSSARGSRNAPLITPQRTRHLSEEASLDAAEVASGDVQSAANRRWGVDLSEGAAKLIISTREARDEGVR